MTTEEGLRQRIAGLERQVVKLKEDKTLLSVALLKAEQVLLGVRRVTGKGTIDLLERTLVQIDAAVTDTKTRPTKARPKKDR